MWLVADHATDAQELERLRTENATLAKRNQQMQGIVDAIRAMTIPIGSARVRSALVELNKIDGLLVKDADGFWARPGVTLAKTKQCETCRGEGKITGYRRGYRFTDRCWTCCGTGNVKA